jgi:long-chain-fatty-acid--CoA ligase ACSBG
MDFPLMFRVADFLILKRIKKALGLDEAILTFYGAAPLKQSSVDYFASLDIILNNCYGLSETTGGITTHKMTDFRLQYAGESLSGGHIKIASPDENGEGEITMSGRGIMMGYLKNEDATKECITNDGYFKSGDLGKLVDGRFLKITGRIKELIISAGGENIAPVPIEDKFKIQCTACSNIMMIGEQRRFMSAIITFKTEIDMKTGIPSRSLTNEAINFFKQEAGLSLKTTDEACSNPKVFELIQKCMNATNKQLVSRAAYIKKFVLLADDFSIPGGELTPTMKLKRKITEKKNIDVVEKMYEMQAKL